MIAEVNYYMEGNNVDICHILNFKVSPMKIQTKSNNSFIFQSSNPILDDFFLLTESDTEALDTRLHIDSMESLDFTVGAHLNYSETLINPDKAAAFKNIYDFIVSKSIPCYMTIRNEDGGEEYLIKGRNPRTEAEIFGNELRREYAQLR